MIEFIDELTIHRSRIVTHEDVNRVVNLKRSVTATPEEVNEAVRKMTESWNEYKEAVARSHAPYQHLRPILE